MNEPIKSLDGRLLTIVRMADEWTLLVDGAEDYVEEEEYWVDEDEDYWPELYNHLQPPTTPDDPPTITTTTTEAVKPSRTVDPLQSVDPLLVCSVGPLFLRLAPPFRLPTLKFLAQTNLDGIRVLFFYFQMAGDHGNGDDAGRSAAGGRVQTGAQRGKTDAGTERGHRHLRHLRQHLVRHRLLQRRLPGSRLVKTFNFPKTI